MAFTDKEWDELSSVLWKWVENSPDEPVLGFLGGGMLTPEKLLRAAEDPSDEDGVAFREILEHAVRHEGMGSVVHRFERASRRGKVRGGTPHR